MPTHVFRTPIHLGPPLQVRLTEEDTEYCVYCVKHVFDAAVVFQFNCTNTIAEQILESVTVLMDMAEAVSACKPAACYTC